MINKTLKFFLDTPLVTFLLLLVIIGWGISTAPFKWDTGILPSDPVPVDAIPDLGENQQIVFTDWPGRSPQDIEDQITYPLTTQLLGIPGVRSIRSSSMFGFSSIYIIFEENVEFYWSRSRILEKLNSLSPDLLPPGVNPALGPDATALGQVYWYTLEGRDSAGNTTGGWDLDELRSIQDFYVKYALSSAEDVAEVASIGGYVKEYQVDVRPEALQAYNIGLEDVMKAIQSSNLDVGAKTLEINRAEYLIRGLGYVKNPEDLSMAVIKTSGNTPVTIGDVAVVHYGPATRRGALDKGGAEVVGGVVVARYGSNPLEVIENIKDQIKLLQPGLPEKVLNDGTRSKLHIVPFYDRTDLIYETLGTLEEALLLEILITIIVIIIMVFNLRASLAISALLPLAILMVFIAMRYTGVDANIVALSGIAIAIGTVVDLGIILTENVIKHQQENPGANLSNVIYRASAEVSSAIITAVSTTIISFIPVFTLEAAEGKLFHPLAFTKTYALMAALIITLFILPTILRMLFRIRPFGKKWRTPLNIILSVAGLFIAFWYFWPGLLLILLGAGNIWRENSSRETWYRKHLTALIILVGITGLLAEYWRPLGVQQSMLVNLIFVGLIIFLILGFFHLLIHYYKRILGWCLNHKKFFLSIPLLLILMSLIIWQGFNSTFGFVARGVDYTGWNIRTTSLWSEISHAFPGLGQEFMPSLDEGSFLLMPTSMPHAGMEENLSTLKQLDMRVSAIPEVKMVVGKMGRVNSALDPAPISMYENLIQYHPEYILDKDGRKMRFAVDGEDGFILHSGDTLSRNEIIELRIDRNKLLPDEDGAYFRNWRDEINSTDDIWQEIVRNSNLPGVTSAPKLQPIETRLVMLQTGMRAPMGIKISGPDLQTLEDFGMKLEAILQKVPSVKREAVFADRVVGKPYITIEIDRMAIARYGLSVEQVQRHIEMGIGGMQISTTVEGRERYPIRLRYPRELRDDPEELKNMLITNMKGVQVPLGQLAKISFIRGPQVIKAEDTFLTSYVLFDKRAGFSEVSVVEDAKKAIEFAVESGDLQVPSGVNYRFSGSYENQVRAEKRLSLVVPLVLVIIFLILYFQFRSVAISLMVFSGIAVAFSGGFILIWLYSQSWFMDLPLPGTDFRTLFQIGTINLSVAVWVGFIALFGIATDDGVLMATYLRQRFQKTKPLEKQGIHAAIIDGAHRRVRPAMMTTATTLIALIPILSSQGKGSDIMIPMAIPIFGGMIIATITVFVVPVLFSLWKEGISKTTQKKSL